MKSGLEGDFGNPDGFSKVNIMFVFVSLSASSAWSEIVRK